MKGRRSIAQALRLGRPGAYQIQAAIAACHSGAATAADTDWREIVLLYGELIRYEPSPMVAANRAVAVAMSEGPAAGLVILDTVGGDARLARWPQLHIARAELLRAPGPPRGSDRGLRGGGRAGTARAGTRLPGPAHARVVTGRPRNPLAAGRRRVAGWAP